MRSDGLDRRARAVHLAAHVDDEGQRVTQPRSFHYDSLVIAIGSQSNDFGTPGVREHALSLWIRPWRPSGFTAAQ
jgi:NADH:ubiquinone reductase (H+-translocating)